MISTPICDNCNIFESGETCFSCDVNDIDSKRALSYAEGYLSSGFGGPLAAAVAGANFYKSRGHAKIRLMADIIDSLTRRGLRRGFDIKKLDTGDVE